MSIENIVSALVKRKGSSFWQYGDTERYSCETSRVETARTIRDGAFERVELPQNTTRYEVQVEVTDKQQEGKIHTRMNFLYIDETLVPLGSHTVRDKARTEVFHIKNETAVGGKSLLGEYLINNLPETVTLTRTLSDAEVAVWRSGSITPIEQKNGERVIHTALHSVTDEFGDPTTYGRLIKFLFPKAELASAFEAGTVTAGTYEAVFRGRETDSPLPFDTELLFTGEAGAKLLRKAYQRWTKSEGITSLPNPHAGKSNAYI
jgi:hypothetical protein